MLQRFGGFEEKKSENPEFKFIPILPDKKSKYNKENSSEFVINFGDVIYCLSAAAMHYIVDQEALGWTLLPPDDFINRVMTGGKFKFEASELELLTQQTETIGYLRKRKLINQKQYHVFDNENNIPAKLGKAPDCFIERLEKIADAVRNKEKSITFPPHSDYVAKDIPRRPERELCFCCLRFKKLFYQDQEKGINVRETKARIYLTRHEDTQRHGPRFIDLNKVFDANAPYELASKLRFVAVTDSIAYCDVKTALSSILRRYTQFAESMFIYADGINYLREIFNRIFRNFNIEFDTSFAFAQENPLVLVVRGENLTRLKSIGAKLIPSQNITPEDKLYLAFGITTEKCVIKKDLLQIDGNDVVFYYSIYNQPGMIKGKDYQSMIGSMGLAIDDKGIGDRFTKFLHDKIRNHHKIVNTLFALEHGGLCYRASVSLYHMFCCRKPTIAKEKKQELSSSLCHSKFN